MRGFTRRLVLVGALFALNCVASSNAATLLFFGSSNGLFTPETPVTVAVRTRIPTEIDVELVPLPLIQIVAIAQRRPFRPLGPSDLGAQAPIRHVHDVVHDELENGLVHTVSFGTLPIGTYAVRISAGDAVAAQTVTVTTLGTMLTDTATSTIGFALDLRTFHRRSDVTVDRYGPGAALERRLADSSGLAVFPFTRTQSDRQSEVYVARGSDGSVALSTTASPYFNAAESEAVYAHTDRPIYRPGHHVFYRAIFRARDQGAYSVATGERDIRVIDPAGKTMFTAKAQLDEFGSTAGDIPLPDDATLGTYMLLVGSGYTSIAGFAVEAYEKPEYAMDISAPPGGVAGGEPLHVSVAARYFFGRPAAGMKVHYKANFWPRSIWWRQGAYTSFAGFVAPAEPALALVEGDTVTDSDGRVAIAVPTAHVDREQQVQVQVETRDDSGKTIADQLQTLVTPGSSYLTVVPHACFAAVGDAVDFTVQDNTYTNVARPGVPISVAFTHVYYANGTPHRDDDRESDAHIVTDASGSAIVHWRPKADGYFEVRASSQDAQGRPIATTSGIWIIGTQYARGYRFERLTVVAQKSSYRPGEPATLLVTAPQGDVDALVRIAGGGSERVIVKRLRGQTSAIEVESPPDVANYTVSLSVPTQQGVGYAQAVVHVEPGPHSLTVTIHPDKLKYAPGDRASFGVDVRDQRGQPARAQLDLAVVDDAIFALKRTSGGDPFMTFYGVQYLYRSTAVSWQNLNGPATAALSPGLATMIGRTAARSQTSAYQPAVTADTYTLGPTFDALRTDFRDTAYWTPAAVTNAAGHATISFSWPDSLTSYTAAAVAVTQGTDIGTGTAKSLVTKDFLVRLSAPRFLRRGDQARITGIAQGEAAAETAQMRFSAPALGVADETVTASFDANASTSAFWNVRGSDLGRAALRLAGTSRSLRDGLAISLPVESAGAAQHARAAGQLPADESVVLQLPPRAEAGDLRIDLAPSLSAQLLADVRLLDVYPYYCVEQTMSAALPAIYVERLLRRLQLAPPAGLKTADVATRAIARLTALQHPDGSWGWWEHDAANPFMSAYALYGLAELSRDGHFVAADVLKRGVDGLVRQLESNNSDTLTLAGGSQPNSQWNTRAFMLFALTDARPAATDEMRTFLHDADSHRADLNPYALSVLGLAHIAIGDRDGALPLLAELGRRETDEGSFTYWKGEGWHYRWEDDPIETTAYALRFLHAIAPTDTRISRTMNWLRSQQHGSWFYTTKDTAAAIFAMSEASTGEVAPHEVVNVTLNGRVLKTLAIESALLSRADASIVVPATDIRNGGTLRFERLGTGALYWSTDWTTYAPADASTAADADAGTIRRLGGDSTAPFTVTRTYKGEHGDTWRVGDVVTVDVTVTANHSAQFVAVEDPMPAGLEYQPKQYQAGSGWSGLQFFDDRVVFFAASLRENHPLHLHYELRATTPGSFTASAPSAYAMYGPPVTALGHTDHVTIR